MAPSILASYRKVWADYGLPKDLLEGFLIYWVKLYSLNHRNRVISFWNIAISWSDPIQRYEGDPPSFFLLQYLYNLGRSFVVVHNIVEQAVASSNLNCSSVTLTDL